MEKETSLTITDHEASQIPSGFAITLPPSQQAPEKNVFQNKFWQGRPSPPRKGVAALMQAAGVFRDIAIKMAGADDIAKHIVDVLKGDKDEAKKTKVLQYFKDNWNTINKDIKYHRPEKISLPLTTPDKSAATHQANFKSLNITFSPVHLAVIYDCKDVLAEIFKHMEEDPEFCKQVLNLKLGTNLILEDLEVYTNIPDEACALSTVFLCVKYNADALGEILEISKKHKMFDDVMGAKEMRGMNLLHFSTMNKSLDCIQTLSACPEEERNIRRSLLYKSRTRAGESPLHSARTNEMIDFLLKSEEKDPCTKEMGEMIYSRDNDGNNVLSNYISRDLDLAEHFLDHHISTNGYNSNSEKFMLCLDVSPIIAQESGKFSVDESSVIGCLEPLTKNKRNVLLHPVINTFIMLKYNSYAAFFFAILLFKMVYAVSVSGLALTAMNRRVSECSGDEGNQTSLEVKHDSFLSDPLSWVWFILAGVMTAIVLVKEVAEMINLRAKWISLHNFAQLFIIVSVFTNLALLILGDDSWYCWMKYLAAWTVFAAWMDITLALRSLMFGKWSSLGLYILMLKEVAKKVFMFFGIYFTSILGFAFVFMLLLPGEDSPFGVEEKAFVKVVAMMIGEVEYGETFADKIIAINLVFLLFVFIIPIIINNLLIGLTVSNVTELILNANMKSLESKIRAIAQFEKSFVMTKIFKNFSSISKNSSQEVCIQPSLRKKSILSECDLTVVHKVDRDDDDQRKMGERIEFLYLDTYVPISVFEESVRRLKG
eukprot:GFUD01011300.1.p1 GENE.GFUD01011300.1~~GFUD01011300.1.p1  ORF type:complete len:769 (+),score=191.85 GFUD01011300.1:38-2344(+)